jgi:hypothetical protein
MAPTTTRVPGVGGELGVGAHPQITPISTHVDIYNYRINTQTNKHQMNWSRSDCRVDQALVIWVLIALSRGDGLVHGHLVPAIGLKRVASLLLRCPAPFAVVIP